MSVRLDRSDPSKSPSSSVGFTAVYYAANITAINETIGIFVAPIAVFTRQITGWDMYNTLCTIEAKDDGPVVKRVVERLFSV